MSKRLLKFYNDGCVPCQILSNYLASNEVEYEDIHAFENLELSTRYGISSVPTLILVDENGNPLDRVVGFNPGNTSLVDELIEQL